MDNPALETLTLITPYYRNAEMLMRQIEEWHTYPTGFQHIIVDDGSPEPALPIVESHAKANLRPFIKLFRILEDIPWNREEARNLGTLHAESEWILHHDIDHLLPMDSALQLANFRPDPEHWYRFPRWRRGKADETRKKDELAPSVCFGQIHPHVDSYLVRRGVYWKTGGYDLDYSGCLGGGNAFLSRLKGVAGEPLLLPETIPLYVYTRSEVKDASDWSLSRDTAEGKRRWREKVATGRTVPGAPVKSPWERQL